MNRLSIEDRSKIVACLCEGMSMRATVRLTGFAKKTVERTLREVGQAVWDYQDEHLVGLPCERIQCDEIWAFCYAKSKNVPVEKQGEFGYGDVWTWVALDADTKLVPCWLVGKRNTEYGRDFMQNLAGRLSQRIQLTTDAFKGYFKAVDSAFGDEVDYAMLAKMYEHTAQGSTMSERKYSPGECVNISKIRVSGTPDVKHVSTSYIERQNLTMRMNMRRLTRLTNAFSKKVENLEYAMALYFMHYNYCRKHQTLKGETPAMAAGVADHAWGYEELTALAAA